MAEFVGVRTSTCKSSRVGCAEGMFTAGGPRNIVFSVLAWTIEISQNSIRVRWDKIIDMIGITRYVL